MSDDEIVSEMEAMRAFRRHKRTRWRDMDWWLGDRIIGTRLIQSMSSRRLIESFHDGEHFEQRLSPEFAGGSDATSD